MTWAERKFPDRWGRRDESAVAAKVQVSIGGVDARHVLVGVQIGKAEPPKELTGTDEAS